MAINDLNKTNTRLSSSEFKPLILDDEEDIQTQDVDTKIKDQEFKPQYIDVDKPKFVQPEQRSYYVAGNVANNEIHTTAQRPNEIEYEADVVDDEKKKDNYFGLSKLKTNKVDIVKNALKYVASRVNPIKAVADDIGKLTGKSGEDVVMEGVRGFAGSTVDFASTLKRFFYQNYMYYKGYKDEQLDKIANLGNVVAGGDSFSEDIKQKYTDFYNRVDEQAKELIDKTERFLQEYGIAKTDKDGFIYDLIGGGASLMYAIGITAITKSPAAAAEFFGMYQYQGLYEEGIEKGFSPIKARTIGVIGGAAEGALEMVGLHMLLETLVARKSFMKLLKAAATEFIQEASQQGAEEFIAKISGMREEGLLTILQNVGYAGLIGALIGGGSAKISDIFHKQISDSATRELINKGVNSDYAKQMVNSMLDYSVSPQVLNEMINILKDEQSPVTYKNADPRETYKETGEAIKKAIDPQQKREIEIEFLDEKKKLTQKLADALINSGKVQNNDEAYRQAEAAVSFYDELAREAYNQENIRPSEYYKRFNVNAQSGNIEIDERNVDEDNPFVDVSFDPVDFDEQARAEYEAAMDAEQDYMDSMQQENKTTLKQEARILGEMGIGAIRKPTADGYGKERWAEYKDLSPRIKRYFFTDTETAMKWDEAEDLLGKDLFEYLTGIDRRAATLNQPEIFNRVLAKEKEDIKQKAVADGTFLKAPNGKDSNLPEQLWLTVRTKAFKNWFGDWENDPQNASKVVDENGEPKVCYHGTPLSRKQKTKNTGWYTDENGEEHYRRQEAPFNIFRGGAYNGLIFFSTDRTKAREIADYRSMHIQDDENGNEQWTEEGYVYDVFLNAKKPLNVANKKVINKILDSIDNIEAYDFYTNKLTKITKDEAIEILSGNNSWMVAETKQFLNAIKTQGYDALQAKDEGVEYTAVFKPNQIKSINNRGTFDTNNPDIYYQAAYHGTPHRFDTFSTEKIGTGEGHQAHGWGLYFAGHREEADKYRKGLLPLLRLPEFVDNVFSLGDKWYEKDEDDNKYYLHENNKRTEINKKEFDKQKKKAKDIFDKDIQKRIEEYKKSGQLYKVDIPENDVLLDEDKTFNEQPKKVQEALLKMDKEENLNLFSQYTEKDILNKIKELSKNKIDEKLTKKLIQDFVDGTPDYFENYDKFLTENLNNEEDVNLILRLTTSLHHNEDLTGREIYKEISDKEKNNGGWYGDKGASLLLNKYGVKGISYFSMQDGQAYVVFDDKAVKVLEKYYQQQQQEQPRGATTVYDRQYFIDLFSTSDKSTLLHETGHVFLSEILYFARSKNASKKVLEIKKRLDEWLGEPEDNGRYSKRQQELFATSAEAFFREGKAPTAKLKTVFERFKKWLSDIYDRIKDDLPNISNDVRELFDTILSRSYDVPDSNIYAGKEKAIKEVIKNIQEGRASEVDGITIDDVYNLLNVAYTRKPSKPSKNLKQLLNDKNIYDFNELNKAGADTVLAILKDGGYVKADATAETAMDLAKQALDGKPVYRLADQWRVAGDIDFARNLRVLERVIEFSQIDSTIEKILELQEEGYRNIEQGDVEQVQNDYKRLFSADVKEAKKIVEDIINRLHKKRFIDMKAKKQMINDLNFSSTLEEIKESVLDVIEDLKEEISLVKEQLRNPRKPIVRKDKTIPPSKNATEEEKNTYKKYMRKQINRLLKQVLPSKKGNNKVSKFGNIETQRFFEDLIKINKMSREEAENFGMDRLAKNNEWIIKDEKGEGFGSQEKIKNMFIGYKAKAITQNSCDLLKELYDNLQKINIAGRSEKQINDYLTKEKRNKDMDELLDNIKKNGSKNKVSNWLKTFYNYAVANWYSCINSIAGEKQAEKDALELLEKNVFVKAKNIQNRIIKRSCEVLGLKTTSQFDKKIHDYLDEKYEFVQNKIDHNGKEIQRKQTLNKMELICCYIWSKNKQLKERIIRAYGNEQFNEMMAKLDKSDTAWGDIIQEETASLYDDVNKVYIKMYGLDMPQAENYFPSATVRIEGNMDLLKEAIIQTSNPSFLKGRVDSNLIIMKFGNPIKIAFDHIFKASRYAVMQEKLADIYKTYLHPDVSDTLKDIYGSDKLFNYIKKMLDNIKFENFTKQVDIVNDMLNTAANTYVMTRIAGKVSIMIKQLLSFTNYMEDVDSKLWLKHFGKMMANPFNFKQIKDFMYEHSPYLKLRYESGAQNEALEKAMEAQAKTILKIKTFKGFLSIMTRIGDIGAIIFGGYPMIQAQLEKGVPIDKAFENFEKATLRSQQANFSSTLSNWQNYCKQNPLLRAIFAFTNTPNQYTRKLIDVCFKMAHGDEKFIKGKGLKTLILYGVEQTLLYNAFTSLAILSGWFDDDWDDFKDDIWLSLFQVSNFLAFPILGQIYNQVVSMYVTGNYVQDKRVPIIDDMTGFFKAMKKAYDDGFGDLSVEDWVNTTDKLASITTGIPLKTLYNTYVTSWGDIINGDYGKGLVKLYGATESRANKIFD